MSAQTEQEVRHLRFEARLAYLDGRVKRAKELNRRADKLERAQPFK
jgi:hypothetical protein